MDDVKESGFKDVLHGRVTTDAVHRRFRPEKNDKKEDHYYCHQCKENIRASPHKEELKSHFARKEHKPVDACVYCSKPVYMYRDGKSDQVYHKCS